MLVLVLGSAAGGGYLNGPNNSDVSMAVRDKIAGTSPRTQSLLPLLQMGVTGSCLMLHRFGVPNSQ